MHGHLNVKYLKSLNSNVEIAKLWHDPQKKNYL